ncbi:MAG: hypothetical protein K9N21_16340 [Deltaproteobacteria bacterium]|nr:hypothetical protein [Deltaproteobacteria bacterium]
MVVIDTGRLKLQLEIMPVASLLLHEEVIPEKANDLVLESRNWADLQNPIIVDKNGMVLDGHHRAFVFRELGFNHILVCRIDYFNPAVQLRYWFRRLGRMRNEDSLKRLIAEMGGRLEQVEDAGALRSLLGKNRLQCGIQQGRYFAAVSFQRHMAEDAVNAYHLVERIQKRLIRSGKTVDYIPCQAVEEENFCQGLRSDEMVIWTPQISKEMVVDAVNHNRRFAPKATRHLIPARPINVNVPITLFRGQASLEEINERLADFLKRKRLRRFGPGQVLNGRYYQEELYVFFD